MNSHFSRAAVSFAALALGACASVAPDPTLLSRDDPRPARLLEAWQAHGGDRLALHALARLAVDAPGGRADGGDLSLRSKQRLWLARPGRLRVEVLGLFDSALAVLAVDGDHYALLQATQPVERGRVYEDLLWDAARLDLAPDEAVALILGAPDWSPDWRLLRARERGDALILEFADAKGRVLRLAEFGASGELRRIEQRDLGGQRVWYARYADFVDTAAGPFAREVVLRSPGAEARIVLRRLELNPPLPDRLFELAP